MNKRLSAKQVAELLGVNVQTVYQYCHTKAISHYRVGHLFKFDPEHVEEFLKKNLTQINK